MVSAWTTLILYLKYHALIPKCCLCGHKTLFWKEMPSTCHHVVTDLSPQEISKSSKDVYNTDFSCKISGFKIHEK